MLVSGSSFLQKLKPYLDLPPRLFYLKPYDNLGISTLIFIKIYAVKFHEYSERRRVAVFYDQSDFICVGWLGGVGAGEGDTGILSGGRLRMPLLPVLGVGFFSVITDPLTCGR